MCRHENSTLIFFLGHSLLALKMLLSLFINCSLLLVLISQTNDAPGIVFPQGTIIHCGRRVGRVCTAAHCFACTCAGCIFSEWKKAKSLPGINIFFCGKLDSRVNWKWPGNTFCVDGWYQFWNAYGESSIHLSLLWWMTACTWKFKQDRCHFSLLWWVSTCTWKF